MVVCGEGDVGLPEVGVWFVHDIIMPIVNVEFMRSIKSRTLPSLSISHTVFLTHFRNGLVWVITCVHLKVAHLDTLAMQALGKLLYSRLAPSEVELRALQPLLQL